MDRSQHLSARRRSARSRPVSGELDPARPCRRPPGECDTPRAARRPRVSGGNGHHHALLRLADPDLARRSGPAYLSGTRGPAPRRAPALLTHLADGGGQIRPRHSRSRPRTGRGHARPCRTSMQALLLGDGDCRSAPRRTRSSSDSSSKPEGRERGAMNAVASGSTRRERTTRSPSPGLTCLSILVGGDQRRRCLQ